MIEVGDHFIYKSKYGGVTEGIIGEIIESNVINLETGYIHRKFSFKSTNNIYYGSDEIDFVSKKLTEEDIETHKRLIKALEKYNDYTKTKKEKLIQLSNKYRDENH